MNSIIKPTLCALALGVCGASPLCAASATASCEQTHSVLYAGGVNQAIMKIKVTAPETSQILKGMTFSMAGTTSRCRHCQGADIRVRSHSVLFPEFGPGQPPRHPHPQHHFQGRENPPV